LWEIRGSYLLTPWKRVLLEKLTGSQLVKNFSAFYRQVVVLYFKILFFSKFLSLLYLFNILGNGESSWWVCSRPASYFESSGFKNLHEYGVSTSRQISGCEQKSIGLKFSKTRTGSDVQYSCHHNSRLYTFPIFAHSWRFSFFHSLQSITPRIY